MAELDDSPVARAAAAAPLAPALIDSQGTLTWAELHAQVRSLEPTLPQSGEPIAICGTPERSTAITMLAAIERRCPIVCLHPRWTPSECELVLAETGAWFEGARRASDHRIAASTLALVYTSGTTGRPKGAILSRRAFAASADASSQLLPLAPWDRWLLCMPLAHVGGLSILTRCLAARAAVLLAGGAQTEQIQAACAHGPTYLSLVPTMLTRLLDSGWTPPSSVRAILVGGAACPERLRERAKTLQVWLTYGLTEACSQVATAHISERAATPLPGYQLRVDGQGRVRVKSPSLFDGWFPPERFAPPIDPDGFYDTGDLGELSQGKLIIRARRSDLIVSGGENVYPAEIESALEQIAGIEAACVFGEPDDVWGERVCAAVVADPELTDASIHSALAARLARFKVPKRIVRLPELAVAASGKLDRHGTRALARSAASPPGKPPPRS